MRQSTYTNQQGEKMKPYPQETAEPTREAIDTLQNTILDYLESHPKTYNNDSIDGHGYSMYSHSTAIEVETTQGIPLKITIEVK